MENETLNKLPEDIAEKCRVNFPDAALGKVGGKPYLTSIKAMYVIERLNQAFGICGWDFTHEIVNDSDQYVTIKGRIVVPSMGLKTPEQYGGHKKTGTGTEPADGYKSAVTDGITKCASYLEIGIDVFKGLGDSPKSGSSSGGGEQDERPWLTKEQLAAMCQAIKGGKGAEVKDRMNKYRMKKTYREQLNALLDGAN